MKAVGAGRQGLTHKVLDLRRGEAWSFAGFDDIIEFNTQCSSQWDSLCKSPDQRDELAILTNHYQVTLLTSQRSCSTTVPGRRLQISSSPLEKKLQSRRSQLSSVSMNAPLGSSC